MVQVEIVVAAHWKLDSCDIMYLSDSATLGSWAMPNKCGL